MKSFNLRNMKTGWRVSAVAVLSMVFVPSLHSGVVVITNAETEISAISTGDLEALYQAKKRKVSGIKVKLTALKKGVTHEEFLTNFVNKSPKQFSAFWKRKVVDGSGIPPKSFKTEEDLLAFIKKTPNSLGYVSDAVDTSGVKTLSVE